MNEKTADRKSLGLNRREFLQRTGVLLLGAAVGRFEFVQGWDTSSAQLGFKRIYIAPDDHTDYMWTAGEAEYQQAFLEMLDYYLDLVDATEGEDVEHQSRWNCDGSFWMWTYERNRPASDFQRLIGRIRDGHISVPLNALCVCLGGAPAEAVLRGMYYAGQIERRHNLRFVLAYTIENQTQPYGLVSLWAGSGAKYSWKGVCGCASKVASLGDREHEIYWWVGPDGSRLLMKWYSLVFSQSLGGYAEAYSPSAAVDALDQKCYSLGHDYGIAGAFGHGWDGFKVTTDQFVIVAKQTTNNERKVTVSNETDFFEDFEATYGGSLPSVAASFGNEWELYCASMAEVSARVKRAVEKLRSAEALAVLVSLRDASFMGSSGPDRDQAWMNLGLYWEHDWTADGPVGREARRDWQRQVAHGIEQYVDALHANASIALGTLIQKEGASVRFYVFNALSWKRRDVADFAYSGANPVHVVDLGSGLEVPSQMVSIGGQTFVRILAADVPAVGYKVFELRSGAGQGFPPVLNVDAGAGVIENDHYHITVAGRGAITSLVDSMRASRQFARVIGGYQINDLGPSSGTLVAENVGPVSVTLRATAPSPLAHTTRVTLFRENSRIQIDNEITENFGDTHMWRYSFDLDTPDVWHEEVGAVMRAKLLAHGGHYSPRSARYDWLTMNHFADMQGSDGVGITLSNADCYFMKLGSSTYDVLDVTTPQVSPLVGGQVDGPSLGIPDQGGDTYFLQRFALRTHDAFDPVDAMRFSLEHQNPLITGEVTGGTTYPAASFSLLTIDNPDALLWALKPAEEGIEQGIVMRMWNLATAPGSFALSTAPYPIASAMRVTHIETPVEPATVTNGALVESLAPQQMRTYQLVLSGAPLVPELAKTVSPRSAVHGGSVTYIVSFVGNGEVLTLTDQLPMGVSAPSDFEISGTAVLPVYDTAKHHVTWADSPSVGQEVVVRYSVTVTVEDLIVLTNVARLVDPGGMVSTASAIVIGNPFRLYLPMVLRDA